MSVRPTPTRHARLILWAAALVLLLKAAVPLLASAAAHVQGKTLVEVCTVYGVKTVALDAQGRALPDDGAPGLDHGHPSAPPTLHGGADCALSPLLSFAAPMARWAAALPAAQPPRFTPPATAPPGAIPDATATWAARLHHAPPALT